MAKTRPPSNRKSSSKARRSAAPENRKRTGGAQRDANGRFTKGKSGNPGGRPKAERTVIELARQYTEEAIQGLLAIARQGESEASRVAAWRELLDRAWGKPSQTIDADLNVFDYRAAQERLIAELERREKRKGHEAD